MADSRVALAAGLGLLAITVAIVTSGSPRVLAGTNAVHPVNVPLAAVPGSGSACQAGETLPAGSTVIGVSLEASAGPWVAVTVSAGGVLIARGVSEAGWIGKVVTIPVAPVDHVVHNVTVCVAFTGAQERVTFLGVRAPARSAARSGSGALPGRMTIEYLRPGSSSWWSLVLSVARRMGLGRAWAGGWVAVLVASVMAACVAVASWLTIRESR